MALFTFDDGIPNAPNNPSNDQPIMLANNVANQGIWDVDHIGFNANNGGTHLQVTMFSTPNYPVIVAPSGNGSVIFPKTGTASASSAQLMFQNSVITTQLSAIRAWGFANQAGIVATQSSNVVSVVRNSSGIYTVTMSTGAVSSTNYAIFVSSADSGAVGALLKSYAIVSSTVFVLTFRSLNNLPTQTATDPTSFTFQVLQI